MLSAMTSGIRNNWMKAIRLVMDLQSSNVKSDSKTSSVDSSRQGSEEVDPASISSRLGAAAASDSKDSKRKEGTKIPRRHHSDINLASNVGQLLKVKEMGDSLDGLDIGNIQVPERSSPSRDTADAGDEPRLKTSVSEPAVDSLPLNRFVEGSENLSASSSSTAVDPTRPKKSESKKEEEERKQRAKSPSARIKDKTRSKAQKIASEDLRMAIPGADKEDSKYSSSEGDAADQESSHAVSVYLKFLCNISHNESIKIFSNDFSSTGQRSKLYMIWTCASV